MTSRGARVPEPGSEPSSAAAPGSVISAGTVDSAPGPGEAAGEVPASRPPAPAVPGADEPFTTAMLLRRSLLVALYGGLIAALFIWGPAICPMRNTFGIPCPGCGLTRATVALAHGDFASALHFHPLVWLMLPIFVVMVIEEVYIFVRRRRLSLLARIPTAIWWPVGALILGVWLARFAGFLGGPIDAPDFSKSWLGALVQWMAG